jgi:hypothetical protein
MIPMGTIVTVCMFGGLLVSGPTQLTNALPVLFRKLIATVVLAAGLWNILWYASQHYLEFWGLAALVSGSLMVVTASYTLCPSKLPNALRWARPLVLMLLLACALLYAITIYHL